MHNNNVSRIERWVLFAHNHFMYRVIYLPSTQPLTVQEIYRIMPHDGIIIITMYDALTEAAIGVGTVFPADPETKRSVTYELSYYERPV